MPKAPSRLAIVGQNGHDWLHQLLNRKYPTVKIVYGTISKARIHSPQSEELREGRTLSSPYQRRGGIVQPSID